MAGRGSQTFKKRQREQLRKEKAQEKFAKRLLRKENKGTLGEGDILEIEDIEGMEDLDDLEGIEGIVPDDTPEPGGTKNGVAESQVR